MNTLTQRDINSRSFTNPMTVFVKRWVDNNFNGWHFTAGGEMHLLCTKRDPTVPPSPLDASSNVEFSAFCRWEPWYVHTGERTQKPSRKGDEYIPPSPPLMDRRRFASPTRTCLSMPRIGGRRDNRWETGESLIIFVHHTVKLRYVRAIDYRTFRFIDRSPQYIDSVSHYIPHIVKKLWSQIKTHTLDPADRISILGFSTLFKMACDANRIHEGVAM